ncbi:hypothetical protein [Marinicella meishanensis]|uniref:hypothetical protein n=1 Tax=Marinicella meishanensis TaxID=2873263 RepID=UPI001CC1ADA4|nr:hypothetical protein [Marinicella sp. NBU2979]
MKTLRLEQQDMGMTWVSDFGMTLELHTKVSYTKAGDPIAYPLFKIYADEQTEEQYMEIESRGKLVQVPISCIKQMIQAAQSGVHSEYWFDEHVFQPKDT